MFSDILLVEDEPLICLALQQCLEDAGFATIGVTNGRDALEILTDEAYRFALLLTDIHLGPGLDGWELARRARELSPDIPVIYHSAHGEAHAITEGVSGSLLLQKPAAEEEILATIAAVLNN